MYVCIYIYIYVYVYAYKNLRDFRFKKLRLRILAILSIRTVFRIYMFDSIRFAFVESIPMPSCHFAEA